MISDARRSRLLALAFLLMPGLAAAASPGKAGMTELPPRVEQAARSMADHPEAGELEQAIVVDVATQRLYLFEKGALVAAYPVSTAERGTGNREGSMRTPLGLHRVAEKFGGNAPPGMIFRGRRATGEIAEILTGADERAQGDEVTSRILWLEGLEPGVNRGGEVDSRRRYIYIHGTPEEGRVGRPASHGCVRMTNADVIELFERVEVGALVDIVE
jgi:lipoprotein-anchoring transpeptidase ErfK/SrfK